MLRNKKALGVHNPQALFNTMFFMIWYYFALRSGEEHRQLRYDPWQIEVIEKAGERPYLLYTEDISKNRPGLNGRKYKPKTVTHYANIENLSRCFVRILKNTIFVLPIDQTMLFISPS